MKLILDFDDVLFNAEKFKEIMFATLATHGIENGQALYDAYKNTNGNFKPKDFLRTSCESVRVMDADVEGIYEEIMSECPNLTNQELVTLIGEVGKENCFIVSSGDEEFQMDKIKRSGADQLVAKVVVVPGSKKLAIELICSEFPDEEIIFADDKLKFFGDIGVSEAAQNLKTVLFNDSGMGNLTAEIEDSKRDELRKGESGFGSIPEGPRMR